MNRILIVGVGGIGSYLADMLNESIQKGTIQPFVVTLCDFDNVELSNVKYQNFTDKDILKNKARVLADRYKDSFFSAIEEKVQLKDILKHDIVICCVDNYPTRERIFTNCCKHNKEYIDLRAEGRKVFAMPKLPLKEALHTLISKDKTSGSCQDPRELRAGNVQYGNRIVATIGFQMLMNLLRNHTNRIHLFRI